MLKTPETKLVKIPAKALAIKNEYVYYIGDNDIKDDKSKINVNREIDNIETSNIDENLKEYVSFSLDNLKNKLDKKGENLENVNFENISNYIRKKDFSSAIDEINKKSVPLNENYLKDKIFRYSLLKETFENGKIFSKNSGLISKNIDGLENIYNFSIIDLLDQDDFNFENYKSKDTISGVKIVDNLKYYLCLKIEQGLLKNLNIGDSLSVNFGEKSFTGIINKVKKSKLFDLVILEFNSGFEEILDKRFLDVTIEKSFNKVYELPKTSLLEEDGKYYIISVDSFNNMKKVNVFIKYFNDLDNTIYVDSVKSYIGPFYNILKDTSSIKKGEILK